MLSCFSLAWAMQLCIAIVIIIGVWSIIQLLLPYAAQFLPGVVIEIIRIVFWVVLAIFTTEQQAQIEVAPAQEAAPRSICKGC